MFNINKRLAVTVAQQFLSQYNPVLILLLFTLFICLILTVSQLEKLVKQIGTPQDSEEVRDRV